MRKRPMQQHLATKRKMRWTGPANMQTLQMCALPGLLHNCAQLCTNCFTWLANECICAAQGHVTYAHYKASKYILHRACAASMMRRPCKYVAQGLQISCTGLASVLHVGCKYHAQWASQYLQIRCTGITNMQHTKPANPLQMAWKSAARGVQT